MGGKFAFWIILSGVAPVLVRSPRDWEDERLGFGGVGALDFAGLGAERGGMGWSGGESALPDHLGG